MGRFGRLSRESGNLEFVHFLDKDRRFVPLGKLGKGDAAFFAAGGVENA